MRWDNLRATGGPGTGDAGQARALPLALPGAVVRTFDTPEFQGMTFYEVRAKSIINRVPGASRVPFEWTVNPYRGCTHACVYCLAGGTAVLRADGTTTPIGDLRVGDEIVGTQRQGRVRRYVTTRVLAHWSTVKPAFRVTLHDGTVLVTSGNHRFLSDRGWKHVVGAQRGPDRRPYLTTANRLMGVGRFAAAPVESADYRRGYLCGFVHGDGHVAPVPPAALTRARAYATDCGGLHPLTSDHREYAGASVRAASVVLDWPKTPGREWRKGFVAGLFDADGSADDAVLRFGGAAAASARSRASRSDAATGGAGARTAARGGTTATARAGAMTATARAGAMTAAGVAGKAPVGGAAPVGAVRARTTAGLRARTAATGLGTADAATWSITGVSGTPAGTGTSGAKTGRGDKVLVDWLVESLAVLGFAAQVDDLGPGGVRLLGGLRERLRFKHTVRPTADVGVIDGEPVRTDDSLRIVSIEPLGFELPMFDITTGTGDFIADGVVSHNCFARQTHTYLDLDAGRDFDTQVIVKVNAGELLRRELGSPRWSWQHIAMGTNVDVYQRAEGRYRLMRDIIAALRDHANPFSILTKGTLIARDLDLLREAATATRVGVSMSIGFVDEVLWRSVEPGTPSPRSRLDVVRRLGDAGLPVGVLMAPILPGLTDTAESIDATVSALAKAGAVSITPLALHLRPGAREWYLAWLRRKHPRLLPLYQELYGERAYASQTYQREVAARVRMAARRFGMRTGGTSEAGQAPTGPQGPPARAGDRTVAAPPPGEQLTLL